MSTYDRIAAVYTLDNYPLLISTAISAALGFWSYALAFRQLLKKGTTCVSFWVHTAFLAHDSSLAIRSLLAAPEHDYHWYLIGYGIGLLVWTAQEIFCIYLTITDDRLRQETWGPYRPLSKGGRVSKSDALWSTVKQLLGFYTIFNYVYERFAPDGAPQFDWFILSIVLDSWGSVQLWRTRTTREHNNLAHAVVVVLAAAWSFSPWNMWAIGFPDLYDTFWYRAMGVATVGISIANLKILLNMPARAQPLKNGKAR